MAQTIIGIFHSYSQARDAAEQLIQDGFPRDDLSFHSVEAPESVQLASSTEFTDAKAYPKVLQRVEDFFSRLFGNDSKPEEVGHYTEAVRRGATLLSAEAETEERVVLARAVFCRAGAVNLDVCVATWQGDGYVGFDSRAGALDSDQIAAQQRVLQEAAARNKADEAAAARVYARGGWQ